MTEEVTSVPDGEPVMIEGKPVSSRTAHTLTDIIQRGEILELKAKRDLLAFAKREGSDVVPDAIEARWIIEVNATAWPRPDFVLDALAAVERELDQRRQHVRVILEGQGEDFDEIHKAMYALEPNPELVEEAEEAEQTWQRAISYAARDRGYVVRFNPPTERAWAQP